MLPSNRTYGFWLAILRIGVGGFWIARGVLKFTQSDKFMPPNGFMPKMIADNLAASSGPYHDFLLNVVTPNIEIFAEVVRVGEVLVGISLVLGFLTRLGGFGGMFLTLNYMLAKAALGSVDGWTGLDGAAFALSAINFVLPTGRVMGFDWFLSRPRAPQTTPITVTPAAPTVAAAGQAPVHAEFVEERPLDGPTAPKD
jgi:uncharacterized membrane protein YphA (DoxX/SURF4 family)